MTSIKQVSEETGLTTYAIRYYEKEGLLNVPRKPNGIRDFDERSIHAADAIAHYRNAGMKLDDIRTVFENYHDHNLSTKLLKETLVDLDDKIASLEATREYLVHKIGVHQRLADEQNRREQKNE